MEEPKLEKLLNRKEAAAYLGLHPGTLRVWACVGRYDLPYYKIGRAVRYKLSDLEKFQVRQLFKEEKGKEAFAPLTLPHVRHQISFRSEK